MCFPPSRASLSRHPIGAPRHAPPQVEGTVAAPNSHYALPGCDQLDPGVSYAGRACARMSKASLKGPKGPKGARAEVDARSKGERLLAGKAAFVGKALPRGTKEPMKGAWSVSDKPAPSTWLSHMRPFKAAFKRRRLLKGGMEPGAATVAGGSASDAGGLAGSHAVSVALCVTGQLRVMVARKLHCTFYAAYQPQIRSLP